MIEVNAPPRGLCGANRTGQRWTANSYGAIRHRDLATAMGYFRSSFLVTGAGLALGAFLGWEMTHRLAGALSTMFIVAVLAILEVSLSFDNAVVNAVVLKKMTPVWRHRFITWGIARNVDRASGQESGQHARRT